MSLLCAELHVTASAVSIDETGPKLTHPDEACAGCHAEIYARYERTSMARGSGLARDGVLTGEFLHPSSDVTYRVFQENGALWMSFARVLSASGKDLSVALHGKRRLIYFIGSGHRGRTYLYEIDGQWFELPINYYGKRGLWDMAPNYDHVTRMPPSLPVDASCLHCHATSIGEELPQARNRFAAAPFAQGGVGCSSCHGDAAKHLAQGGRGGILNPDKLTPAKRDDVCLQCHLEGDAVVYRTGRSLAQFRPGDRLDEDAVYFVRASAEGGGQRAMSQYEALLRSACKAGSGDRLTCTTCHNPHETPAPEQRVSFFRARCLSCHTSEAIALRHHPEQKDCAFCHMPTRATTDISHEQLTDHDIQRFPPRVDRTQHERLRGGEELRVVGTAVAGERELGLAYAQMAERGDQEAGARAIKLLEHAEAGGASDAPLHTQLGFLAQVAGQQSRALQEYTLALQSNPYEPTALANLAVLKAASGQIGEAIPLLRRVLETDPAQIAAGLNLAFIECRTGAKTEAVETLHLLQRFSPDDPQLFGLLEKGMYQGQRCDLH